jgi:hypothetical protein
MATLREIGLFVWSVLTHWQALATGGIITGLLLVAEMVFDWPLSRQAFIVVVVVVFLLAAFFFAWRDEYRTVQAERAYKTTIANDLADRQRHGRKIYVRWWTHCQDREESATDEAEAEQWRLDVMQQITNRISAAEAEYFNTPRAAEAAPPTSLVNCPRGVLINELGHRVDRLGEIIQRVLTRYVSVTRERAP